MAERPSRRATRTGFLALLLAATAPLPAAAQLHLAAELGVHGDAGGVEGYGGTELGRTPIYGPSLGYRFGFGLDLELAVRRFAPRLTESSVDFGVLDLAAVLFRAGFRSLPSETGVGAHAGLGAGYAVADFRNGSFLNGLSQQAGRQVEFMTKGMPSVAFEIEAGAEYFVTPWLALTACLRGMILRQDFKILAGAATVPIDAENPTFVLIGGDVSVGLQFWLWRWKS